MNRKKPFDFLFRYINFYYSSFILSVAVLVVLSLLLAVVVAMSIVGAVGIRVLGHTVNHPK